MAAALEGNHKIEIIWRLQAVDLQIFAFVAMIFIIDSLLQAAEAVLACTTQSTELEAMAAAKKV